MLSPGRDEILDIYVFIYRTIQADVPSTSKKKSANDVRFAEKQGLALPPRGTSKHAPAGQLTPLTDLS